MRHKSGGYFAHPNSGQSTGYTWYPRVFDLDFLDALFDLQARLHYTFSYCTVQLRVRETVLICTHSTIQTTQLQVHCSASPLLHPQKTLFSALFHIYVHAHTSVQIRIHIWNLISRSIPVLFCVLFCQAILSELATISADLFSAQPALAHHIQHKCIQHIL